MPQKIWNPEEYDTQCVLQYNTAMEMLNEFLLEGNETVLDVGCGTGKITAEIAKRTPKGLVLGLDVNKKMVDFAKEKYTKNNLFFVNNDVLSMKYQNCFDVVVSFWTLSWIPLRDQVKALNNIVRSLTENGRILLMYPLRHDAYTVVSEVITRPQWERYFSNYEMPRSFISEAQYRFITQQIPMTFNLQKKELKCKYKDDEEMISSINCWLAHVDEIPSEHKSSFLVDVASAYKTFRNISEPTMYYSTLEITGIKNSLEYQPKILSKF